jgi:hypothetical protein
VRCSLIGGPVEVVSCHVFSNSLCIAHRLAKIPGYVAPDLSAVRRDSRSGVNPGQTGVPDMRYMSPRNPEQFPASYSGLATYVHIYVGSLICIVSLPIRILFDMTSSNVDANGTDGLAAARQVSVPNPLRNKLIKGQLAHALSIKLISSIEIVGYAAAAKYDSILIDLEHSPFGLETTNQLSCAALALGYVDLFEA